MINEETRLDFIEKHAPRALCHYDHAKQKHPYFCDGLLPTQVLYTMAPGEIPSPMTKDSALHVINVKLRASRERIRRGTFSASILWNELLDCEVWEATEAIAKGDKAQAVEELYDAIAVCLRAIDVIEGRQKLGKPEAAKEEWK